MYRLFVAIDLPDPVRDAMTALCTGIPGARWVPQDQLHLTLRFIGDADEADLAAITDGLGRVEGKAFPLTIQGVGHFPPGTHPRVLWVGVSLTEQLRSLQDNIERAVTAAGMTRENRRFSPHITLARLKEPLLPKVEAFEAKNRYFSAPPFTVTEFHLYSSALSSKGAVHTRQKSYPLP